MNTKFFNDLLSGKVQGGTFTFAGDEIVPRVSDVVTLACKTVSGDLTPDELSAVVLEFIDPYARYSGGLLYPGFFRLATGEISIDINVLVPPVFRNNTFAFAKANGQEAIYLGLEGVCAPTGGNGIAKLNPHVAYVSSAARSLVVGRHYAL